MKTTQRQAKIPQTARKGGTGLIVAVMLFMVVIYLLGFWTSLKWIVYILGVLAGVIALYFAYLRLKD
jgi:hypothetical protein